MTFNNWLSNRQVPDADRIPMMVQQSGQNGIPEGELRGRVELPKQLVDQLLVALVNSRMVKVLEKGGMRVYFSR